MISEATYKERVSLAHRKRFAQFFTPDPIAEIMVSWVLQNPKVETILEPAFGLGVFSRHILKRNQNVNIKGFDVDEIIFNSAKSNFIENNNIKLFLENYLFNDWDSKYDAIICNPPYFKFHDYENKATLTEIKKRLKINLSGFTNVYTLFLLKSIEQLKDNGRAAYIVPSEFLNSDYGTLIKEFLIKEKVLRHVAIVDFNENVFDDALTTSSILFLAKDEHTEAIHFSNIQSTSELKLLHEQVLNYPVSNGKVKYNVAELDTKKKWRVYYQSQESTKYKNLIPFSTVAKVTRGIATGANKYFTFNKGKAMKYGIADEFLLPCVTKSKDIDTQFFTNENFEVLKSRNVDIFLLDANRKTQSSEVVAYLKLGEKEAIHEKFLTSRRTPWYKLENRIPPPIWVGVFNRNGLKFVRNEAKITNLTTFHCIYQQDSLFGTIHIDLLFAYLLTDVAHQIFNDNRREYGDGLKKFEPNDLNKAQMLDLSILDNETKDKIIELLHKYRSSVIDNNLNFSYIEEINEIFIEKYRL